MKLHLLGFMILMMSISSGARPIWGLNYDQLNEVSDLIAVVRYQESYINSEKLTSADPPPWVSHLIKSQDGPRNFDHYQGWTTKLEIITTFKGSSSNTIQLIHFTTKVGIEFNGGSFMVFPDTEARLKGLKFSNIENSVTTGRGGPLVYLAFLKRRDDGFFVPVSGNYDASQSFKLLAEQPYYAYFWDNKMNTNNVKASGNISQPPLSPSE